MLVLTRKAGEKIIVGSTVVVTLEELFDQGARLAVSLTQGGELTEVSLFAPESSSCEIRGLAGPSGPLAFAELSLPQVPSCAFRSPPFPERFYVARGAGIGFEAVGAAEDTRFAMEVRVLAASGARAKLGVIAPIDTSVLRYEIYRDIQAINSRARLAVPAARIAAAVRRRAAELPATP
jgi:sRNA-binding carbon storage regulator CsrA